MEARDDQNGSGAVRLEEVDTMKKQPFKLGDDVALALMQIVSINDDLPAEYRAKIEQAKEEAKQ
jgi:hypothetical protein